MNQLIDFVNVADTSAVMPAAVAVNEVSCALSSIAFQPTMPQLPLSASARSALRKRVAGCSGGVANLRAMAAQRSQSNASTESFGRGLLIAFWLSVIGGFAVVAWQLVLLFQSPVAPQLLPWVR
ncbi:MAG: hypothetical protein LBJ43_01260 [Propionibacteriaceae bacterium]|jgi:hypothetical protein|nr:hypothetical protein [Propionibacteriaceae bacterium]